MSGILNALSLIPREFDPRDRKFIKAIANVFESEPNVDTLFYHLNKRMSFENYTLLQYLINTLHYFHCHRNLCVNIEKLQGDMCEYERDYMEWRSKIDMEQMINHRFVRAPPSNSSVIITVLKKDPPQYTLKIIEELRDALSRLLHIPRHMISMKSISPGSLCIKWYIPSSKIQHFRSISQSKLELISAELLRVDVDTSTVSYGRTDHCIIHVTMLHIYTICEKHFYLCRYNSCWLRHS